MNEKTTGNVGSSFDDFLAEEGILEICEEQAIERILADQIEAEGGRPSDEVCHGQPYTDQLARSG